MRPEGTTKSIDWDNDFCADPRQVCVAVRVAKCVAVRVAERVADCVAVHAGYNELNRLG